MANFNPLELQLCLFNKKDNCHPAALRDRCGAAVASPQSPPDQEKSWMVTGMAEQHRVMAPTTSDKEKARKHLWKQTLAQLGVLIHCMDWEIKS